MASVAAVGFQLLTPAGQTHLNHVWAEDGALFLRDSLTRPFGSNLAAPYGGYLHVVPRLIAELMSVLPLTWAPIVVAVLVALLRAGHRAARVRSRRRIPAVTAGAGRARGTRRAPARRQFRRKLSQMDRRPSFR